MSVGMRIQYVRAKLAGVIQSCPTRKRLIIIKYCLPNPAYHLEAQGESPLASSGPGVNNFGKVAGSARDRVRRRPELLTPRCPAKDQGGGRGRRLPRQKGSTEQPQIVRDSWIRQAAAARDGSGNAITGSGREARK